MVKIKRRKVKRKAVEATSTRPQLEGVNVGGCPVSAEAMAKVGKPQRVLTVRCTKIGSYPSTLDGTMNRALLGLCPYCGERVWLVRVVKHTRLYTAYCGNAGAWLWAGAGDRVVQRSADKALGH